MVEELDEIQTPPTLQTSEEAQEEERQEIEEREEQQRTEPAASLDVEQIEKRVAEIILQKINQKLESLFEKGLVIVINNYYNYTAPQTQQPVPQVPQTVTAQPQQTQATTQQEERRTAVATRRTQNRQDTAEERTAHRDSNKRRHIVTMRGIAWLLGEREGLSLEEAQKRLPSFLEGRVAVGIPGDVALIDKKLWEEARQLYPDGTRPTVTELMSQFGLSEREAEVLASALEQGMEIPSDEDVLDEFVGIFTERMEEAQQQQRNQRRGAAEERRGEGYARRGNGYRTATRGGGYRRSGRGRGGEW